MASEGSNLPPSVFAPNDEFTTFGASSDPFAADAVLGNQPFQTWNVDTEPLPAQQTNPFEAQEQSVRPSEQEPQLWTAAELEVGKVILDGLNPSSSSDKLQLHPPDFGVQYASSNIIQLQAPDFVVQGTSAAHALSSEPVQSSQPAFLSNPFSNSNPAQNGGELAATSTVALAPTIQSATNPIPVKAEGTVSHSNSGPSALESDISGAAGGGGGSTDGGDGGDSGEGEGDPSGSMMGVLNSSREVSFHPSSFMGAASVKIGQWEFRTAKPRLDVMSRFLYSKKVFVLDFREGEVSKKLEVSLSKDTVAAIDCTVPPQGKSYLTIVLRRPPAFFINNEAAADFTNGEASKPYPRVLVTYQQGPMIKKHYIKLIMCDGWLKHLNSVGLEAALADLPDAEHAPDAPSVAVPTVPASARPTPVRKRPAQSSDGSSSEPARRRPGPQPKRPSPPGPHSLSSPLLSGSSFDTWTLPDSDPPSLGQGHLGGPIADLSVETPGLTGQARQLMLLSRLSKGGLMSDDDKGCLKRLVMRGDARVSSAFAVFDFEHDWHELLDTLSRIAHPSFA